MATTPREPEIKAITVLPPDRGRSLVRRSAWLLLLFGAFAYRTLVLGNATTRVVVGYLLCIGTSALAMSLIQQPRVESADGVITIRTPLRHEDRIKVSDVASAARLNIAGKWRVMFLHNSGGTIIGGINLSRFSSSDLEPILAQLPPLEDVYAYSRDYLGSKSRIGFRTDRAQMVAAWTAILGAIIGFILII